MIKVVFVTNRRLGANRQEGLNNSQREAWGFIWWTGNRRRSPGSLHMWKEPAMWVDWLYLSGGIVRASVHYPSETWEEYFDKCGYPPRRRT